MQQTLPRLSLAKTAKEEFQHILQLGIIHPSQSQVITIAHFPNRILLQSTHVAIFDDLMVQRPQTVTQYLTYLIL